MMSDIRYRIAPCTLGHLLVAASAEGVCMVAMADDAQTLEKELKARVPQAHQDEPGAGTRLAGWIADVVALVDNPVHSVSVPLDLEGTPFQLQVWQALADIPSGETRSYSQVAEVIGRPRAVRAVANACAANPVAVLVPCHRVVRRDGSPSGYRWGLWRKQALLQREQED